MADVNFNSERCKRHTGDLRSFEKRIDGLEAQMKEREKVVDNKLELIIGKLSFIRGAAVSLVTVFSTLAAVAGLLTITGKL